MTFLMWFLIAHHYSQKKNVFINIQELKKIKSEILNLGEIIIYAILEYFFVFSGIPIICFQNISLY